MKVSYGTDVGIVRSDNQDTVYCREISENCGLFVVADGMGGHRGGKTASSMAADAISDFFDKKYTDDMTSDEIKELMVSAVNQANKDIFEKSDSDEELYGMGTTIVAMFIRSDTLYTASVGDSRAYVYNGTRMYQITTDHSLVADLINMGVITAEEAKNHPQKNVITRAVGSEEEVLTDIFETPLHKDNIVVACSDGLYGLVSDDEIAEIISEDADSAAQKLIALANERGGNDNITVVVVKNS